MDGISWDWAMGGVNKTVPRNAGPECAEFLDPTYRLIETAIVLVAMVLTFVWSYRRIKLPTPTSYGARRDRGGRRTLLVLMSLIWGMEIGYKFSSRTVIYLLNPCHVTTALQVSQSVFSSSTLILYSLNLLNVDSDNKIPNYIFF